MLAKLIKEKDMIQTINIRNGKGSQLKIQQRDFPGDLVVKNPPSNAGDVGLIPHVTEQLSPCATTAVAVSHNY